MMGLPDDIKVHGIQGLLGVSQLLEVDTGKAQELREIRSQQTGTASTGSAGLNFSHHMASGTCECRKCEESFYHTDLGRQHWHLEVNV